MHDTRLSGDDFADLFEASDLVHKHDAGPTAILVLRHPKLGQSVVVDDFFAGPSLVSPEPFDPAPRARPLW